MSPNKIKRSNNQGNREQPKDKQTREGNRNDKNNTKRSKQIQ